MNPSRKLTHLMLTERAGPDRVALPGDLQSGEYRVCTANAGDEFCAPLTITPN